MTTERAANLQADPISASMQALTLADIDPRPGEETMEPDYDPIYDELAWEPPRHQTMLWAALGGAVLASGIVVCLAVFL